MITLHTATCVRVASLTPPPPRPCSHLHNLDLRFHLDRQTGALQRTVDRGSRSINFVLTSLVFNVVPTALEIALVAGACPGSAGAAGRRATAEGDTAAPGSQRLADRTLPGLPTPLFPFAGILSVQFGWAYGAVTLATLAGYVWFTVAVTTWRTTIRKDMNR
jgi:ATP-binding cassette, subfamily B (MDR/TAP), member 7